MNVKAETLKILLQNTGTAVSGEALAGTLGVSRNAVWKAVRALRNDGYEITSATNRGYCLTGAASALSAEIISGVIGKTAKVFVYDVLDSTNAEAKRMAAAGFQENALIVADRQTAGRGRLGRSFYSPAKTGLYMSYMYRPDSDISDNVAVTSAAAVAAAGAIETVTGRRTLIKWVNDLYIGERKVCGILTEAIGDFETGTAQCIIVGVGINITTADFPEELSEKAASLGCSVDRNMLTAETTIRLAGLIQDLPSRSYMTEYRERSLAIGREVVYTRGNESCQGTAVGVDDDGGLIVETPSGRTVLKSGEISLKVV